MNALQSASSAAADTDDDAANDEQQLADMMKRLGLPTEFGAAKRHKQQPPLDTAALASSASASASASTHGTDTTAVAAASPAAGRGSKAQRKRRRQQQQQQRGGLDAAQRWQRRANKPDVYDNPSYVGRLVLAASKAGVSSEQAGEEHVVWEEEAMLAWEWQHRYSDRGPVEQTKEVDEPPVKTVSAQSAARTEHQQAAAAAAAWEDAKAKAERLNAEWVEEADEYDYQAGVSLYPHGYGRFAEQSNEDEDEYDDGDHAVMEEDDNAEPDGKEVRQEEGRENENEDEHVDDYGLIQGEVLEGEDHTDAPAPAQCRLRGLPAARGRRVQLDEDGNKVAEQVYEGEEQHEAELDTAVMTETDERPDELPVVVSRSPLLPALPPPPASPPQQSLASSPPTLIQPLPPSTASATPATAPPSPPSYPLSLLPTRFPAMHAAAAAVDSDKDEDEYVQAHAGEVIEGVDRTAVTVRPVSTSVLRGMRRRNKRVVFDADGQQVVVEEAGAAAAAHAEQAESGEQQQQQHHHHQQQQQQQQKVDEPTTSDTAQPLSDPNLTVDVDPKYYAQRYRLFSRYDDGVRLDAVGWYSVTPEAIARHIAARIAGSLGRPFTVVDAFAGLGGNTIAFALQPLCERVVAVELDVQRLQLCRHNAAVYGVSDKCEWVQGDWLQVRQQLRQQQRSVDVVFLAPPWGGVQYGERDVYGLSELAVADGGRPLIEAAMRLAGVEGRVAVSVPRNVDVAEVVQVGCGGRVEVEYNRCNGKVKTVTAYYGGLVRAASAAADGEAQQPELAMAAAPLSFSSRCAGYR